MPWKEPTVSEQRLVLVHRIVELGHPLVQVARETGVSRKTAYKWVARYRQDRAAVLSDRSRRPLHSPARTPRAIEQRVLDWRDQHRWGPRKIHRLMCQESVGSSSDAASSALAESPAPSGLSAQPPAAPVPSVRTIATILRRHGRVEGAAAADGSAAPQLFERGVPNELWQLDHKGPLEIARQKYSPLVILDDHSRYCLKLVALADKTMTTAWNVLWEVLGEVGMPQAILCDNAFGGTHQTVGLSWFDMQLVRLNINPVHGRPYHPQTQGKVERLNGTIERELIGFNARRDSLEHFADDCERWRRSYNTVRPHESLADQPPAQRYLPSARARPGTVPAVEYASDALLRKVTQAGDVYYHGRRIVVGRTLQRQHVRVEEREQEIALYYGFKLLRVLAHDQLGPPRCYKQL